MFKTNGMVSITTHWHKNNDSNTGCHITMTNNTRHYCVGSLWRNQREMHKLLHCNLVVISCIKSLANETLCPNNVSKYQCSKHMEQGNLKARWFITDAVSKWGPVRFIGQGIDILQPKRDAIHASWMYAARCNGNLFYLFVSVSIHDEVIDNLQTADWILS